MGLAAGQIETAFGRYRLEPTILSATFSSQQPSSRSRKLMGVRTGLTCVSCELLSHSRASCELRGLLEIIIILFMATWFFIGLARFPDAPIHQCSPTKHYLYADHPNGFCGKQGQSRTESEFRSFQNWQTGLFLIWPPGMLALFLLKRKRRS
jgi:hypothetical protein